MAGKYKRIYLGSGITLLSLFLILTSLGLDITSDGDKACAGTIADPCISYINISNPTARSIYIYNYDDVYVDFSPDIKSYELYVKYYGKWVYTNFTMQTRLSNIPENRKYVFVFPRYATKEFKLIGYKNNPLDVIKWGMGAPGKYLDPAWTGTIDTETFETGTGSWSNTTGEGFLNWTRNVGSTGSSGTSPNAGVDGIADPYIYVEADVNCGDNFTVEYAPFDFTNGVNVTWYYHMNTDFAIRMGWLYLEVEDTAGVWDVIWTRSKVDLDDVWNFNETLITSYTGSHAIRFRYLTVPEIQCYNADVGLDNITIDINGSAPGSSETYIELSGCTATVGDSYAGTSANLFDNNTATLWHFRDSPDWLNISCSNAMNVNKISYYHSDRNPQKGDLYGYTGVGCTGSRVNITGFSFDGIDAWHNISFTNTNSYYCYEFDYTGGSASWLKVHEINFYTVVSGTPSEPINITITSPVGTQRWIDQKLVLSGTLNDTGDVVYELDGANTTICTGCSSFSTTLDYLNITKTTIIKVYANTSTGLNSSTIHNINFDYINVSSFASSGVKLAYDSTNYTQIQTIWSAADTNDGPNFAHIHDKAKHVIASETYSITVYPYSDFSNVGIDQRDKGQDCVRSAIMCNMSGGNYGNTVYGSPTTYCTIAYKCIEDSNRASNILYNNGNMDKFADSMRDMAIARDVLGGVMNDSWKVKVKDDFYNLSLGFLYRSALADSGSPGGGIGGTYANFDTTSRSQILAAIPMEMLSLDDGENVSGDFMFCDSVMHSSTGDCSGATLRAANETLFPGETVITRQMVIDKAIEFNYGSASNAVDNRDFPDWYNMYAYNFLYSPNGNTYTNFVHLEQDPLFFYVLRGSGLDLFERNKEVYDSYLNFMDGDRVVVPFDLSSGPSTTWGQPQWFSYRAYSLDKSGSNNTLLNKMIYYPMNVFISYQYDGNSYATQNDAQSGYWMWSHESMEYLQDSSDKTNLSVHCQDFSRNQELDDLGFGIIRKSCDFTDTTLYLHAKSGAVDQGRQRASPGDFYLWHNNTYIISPAGTPQPGSNGGVDDSSAFASGKGFNISDVCLYDGDYAQDQWMYGSNYLNMLFVDGYGPQPQKCINGTNYWEPVRDQFSVNITFDNENVSVSSMIGTYSGKSVQSVDTDGITLKRTFYYDNQFIILLDTVTDTNSTHNISRQFALGEGDSKGGTLDMDSSNDNASYCQQGTCVDFSFSDDNQVWSYTSGNSTYDSGVWGWHEILVASEDSDDLAVVMFPRTDLVTPNTVIDYTNNTHLRMTVANTTHISELTYIRSTDVWKVNRWVQSGEVFVDKTDYDGTAITYTLIQGAESYPDATPSDTCTYTSGNWNIDASDNCNLNTNTDVGGNAIIISGEGTITVTAEITNFSSRTITGDGASNRAHVITLSGGFKS